MPVIRISDFGKAGLNTDVEPTLLQQGEWNILDNIDLESGDIRSAWGDTTVSGTCPIVPRYTFVYEGETGTFLIVSDGAVVYAFNGQIWRDISPVDSPVVSRSWDDMLTTWNGDTTQWDEQPGSAPAITGGYVTFTVFLGTLVINFSDGTPAYWPDVADRMEVLPGWPAAWRAESIIAYQNFLVAIGLDNGATAGAKYTVAWSNAAAEGEIPQDWDPAVTGSLAGLLQLRDTDGYLVVAKVLRDDLVLYKNDSIYRMFYTGNEFIFDIERVISDRGCDSVDGVGALGDVHFFADRGDIRVFNGQETQSIAISRIKEALSSAISNENRDKTIVVAYPERDEVWVAVVPAGSTTADVVLVYNKIYDAWSLKRYPGTLSMTLGPFSVTTQSSGLTWDEYQIPWNSAEDTWNQSAYEPSEDGMIFGASPNILYRADKTNSDREGNAKVCKAERSGFLVADIPQSVTVQAVYPEMEGNATVQIQLGAQWFPGDNIRWTLPQSFTPGYSRRLKTRITGQPCAFRITSNVTDGWRLGALSLQVVEARGR